MKKSFLLFSLFIPSIVGAQPIANAYRVPALHTITDLIQTVTYYLNLLIPFLIGLGVFLIIVGVVRYVTEAANEEKRKEARQFVLWGVVDVFIMISIWGLVNILLGSFGFRQTLQKTDIPTIKEINKDNGIESQ